MTSPPLRRVVACAALLVGIVLPTRREGNVPAVAAPGDRAVQAAAVGLTPWIVLKCQFGDEHVRRSAGDAAARRPVHGERRRTRVGCSTTGATCPTAERTSRARTCAGWFRDVGFTSSTTDGDGVARSRLDVIGCIRAADPSVDFRPFYGIIVATTTANRHRLARPASDQARRADEDIGLVLLDSGARSNTWAAHEMGHGYGFATRTRGGPTVRPVRRRLGHHEPHDVRRPPRPASSAPQLGVRVAPASVEP